jgi:dipeptidase
VDYAKGLIKYNDSNNFPTNRMPLWIKPDKKLSVRDVQNMMRDHYQGTELDMTQDVGAGPFALPYRLEKLTWEVDSVKYCNERPISTQANRFFVCKPKPQLAARPHWRNPLVWSG